MAKRYVTIWFRYLVTDWMIRHRPGLRKESFVFAAPVHGRMMIAAACKNAEANGITAGIPVADAKAIDPSLHVLDNRHGLEEKLLRTLAEWSIRYTPTAAVDLPDGLTLDASGCAHLWGGEEAYVKEIVSKLGAAGFDVRAAMADTIGTAWAVARYGEGAISIVQSGDQATALLPLHPAALRPDPAVLVRLQKLGFRRIAAFANMPRAALRRRFGEDLLTRLSQALGQAEEFIQPIFINPPYQERLNCLEPIRTAAGIEIAIRRLLDTLCKRLESEGKGLRSAVLKCFRVDGKTVEAAIGTNRASHNAAHLYKLFELKIPTIEPALGIELFVLEAPKVEETEQQQEKLWATGPGLEDAAVAELLDRLAGKAGVGAIRRFLPDEHYWPERSVTPAASLKDKPADGWRLDRPRPVLLLPHPEAIEVSAPIPDYPPMLFRYRGRLHEIRKADGPERIEREWWLDGGEHRDYYTVEDEQGQRYWLFRSGHYNEDQRHQWFIHGFFA
ncbi:Y-family DNA polymerase [Chitinophaga barathri]|uniref:DNA polymerase Y family protein n=1 Tax=Chitinophaga barathri TaxID=1647451 RepID=A0A3N4MI63_9BACT|nr:DNA polymerase Y family protein [Chitinophaga barathri]RPD41477.1 DNA polymerase Y family protein [Chitinophaga barathri]